MRVTLVQEELEELEVVVQVQALLMWQLLVHLIQEEVAGVEANVLALVKVVMVARVS